ncbi:hypothetical protein NE602_27605, partial [Bacteroides cellulosilyticus]
ATGNILTDDSNSILNSYLQWLLSRIENQRYRLTADKSEAEDQSFSYDWATQLLKDYGVENQMESRYISKIV